MFLDASLVNDICHNTLQSYLSTDQYLLVDSIVVNFDSNYIYITNLDRSMCLVCDYSISSKWESLLSKDKSYLLNLLHIYYATGYIDHDIMIDCQRIYSVKYHAIISKDGNSMISEVNDFILSCQDIAFDTFYNCYSFDDYYLLQDDWKTIILKQRFEIVEPYDFYSDLFFSGDYFQYQGKEHYNDGRTNAIAVELIPDTGSSGNSKQTNVKRYTITAELDQLYDLFDSNNFILMSPITYIGKQRSGENARYIYAIAIDLDGTDTLFNMLDLFVLLFGNNEKKQLRRLPAPTYIVNSGTGLHIYYVFDKPIPLYKNTTKELQKAKEWLTKNLWADNISSKHAHIQYQPILQGFRLVGGVTKDGKRTCAFKVNVNDRLDIRDGLDNPSHKISIEYLNKFLPKDCQIEHVKYVSDLTLKEAEAKYPEWYQRRVIEKQDKGHWTTKPDLYYWWLNEIKTKATLGHRYFCIMCLAVYAKKAGIDRETLEKDAYDLVELFEGMTQKDDNHFTAEDVIAALEMYDDNYYTFPIDTITQLTNIAIEKNKRNGRDQETHLQIARAIRDITNPNWNKSGNGRKSKIDVLIDYLRTHPNSKKSQAIRDTGLAKSTVYKWWDDAMKEVNRNTISIDGFDDDFNVYYRINSDDKVYKQKARKIVRVRRK